MASVAGVTDRIVAELRGESFVKLKYVLGKMEECADRMVESEPDDREDEDEQVDRVRECLEWLGGGGGHEEDVVDVVIPVFKPRVLHSTYTVARLLGGERFHKTVVAVVKSKACLVYTLFTTAVFACTVPMSLVASEEPLVPYWVTLLFILLTFIGYAFAALLLLNVTSLKTLFYSFDVWYLFGNMLIVGLTGGEIFATSQQSLIWCCLILVIGPIASLMDAHPYRRKMGGHYFVALLCFIAVGLGIFFEWFAIVPVKIYVFGKDISLTNRCYAALSNVAIFLARFVIRGFVDRSKLVQRPGVREKRMSKAAARRAQKDALAMEEFAKRAQSKSNRLQHKVVPVTSDVVSNACSGIVEDESKGEHLCKLVANILIELQEQAHAQDGNLEWSHFDDTDKASAFVLKVAHQVSHELVPQEERSSLSTLGKLKTTILRASKGSEKAKDADHRDKAKARKTAMKKNTVRVLVPTHKAKMCDDRDSLARWVGGMPLHRLVRSICRNKCYQFAVLLTSLGMLCFSLAAFSIGSDLAAAVATACALIAMLLQMIQLGLCRMALLAICLKQFSTWFFIALVLSIGVNGALCASTPLHGIQILAFFVVGSSYLLFDAMPFRRHTRRAMSLFLILFFLYLGLLFWQVWQELTPAFEERQLNIFGQRLSTRQTMLSSTGSLGLFITQFIYRAFASRSRLIFLHGLDSCRLRRNQARMLVSIGAR